MLVLKKKVDKDKRREDQCSIASRLFREERLYNEWRWWEDCRQRREHRSQTSQELHDMLYRRSEKVIVIPWYHN